MTNLTYQVYFQKVMLLSENKKKRMSEIYFDYYSGSTIQCFYNDLQNKDEVLFLEYDQQIVGFTTIQYYQKDNSLIVYSGDTIVDSSHRQQQSLHKAWLQRMGILKKQNPNQPIYWFLLVKGYKTYKYLVIFAKEFHPHWSQEHPELKKLTEELGREKFGDLYEDGIIKCPPSYGYLKDKFAELTASEKKKNSAQFFIKMNPFYYQGHELACLCEISKENLHSKFLPSFEDINIEFRNE